MPSSLAPTAQQRSARLRRAALDALGRYGLDIARVRLLIDEWNCSFRIETASGDRYVLRLTSPKGCHGLEETRAELAWLQALTRDTDLTVPRPVPMADGTFIGVVDRELAPTHRQYVLFRWTPGRTLGDRVGPRTACRLGGLAAALHEHARAFTLPADGRVRRFDRSTLR